MEVRFPGALGRKLKTRLHSSRLVVGMSPLGRNIMFTKSFNSPSRLSTYVLTALLFSVPFCKGAVAQGTTPLVTASYAQGLTPPTGLGTVFQTALDSYGDLLFVDYANGGLYEYPVNGGAVVTLVPTGGLGGYANPGIVIDSNNNLYLEANYNNC